MAKVNTPPRTNIILEGPDGAGKSTLGQRLAADLGYEYIHTGGGQKDTMELICEMDYRSRMLREANTKNKGIIYDRISHISSAIYRIAFGEKPLANQVRCWRYLKEDSGPIVIVYVRRMADEDMLNSVVESKKDHKSPEHLKKVKANFPKIVELYDDAMPRIAKILPVFDCYDWELTHYESLLMPFLKKHGVRHVRSDLSAE